MWQSDPFKAKWSVLAKAYSILRDGNGKHNTPLDKFLAINGPLVGIIGPQDYLQKLGWHISVSDDGHAVLLRTPTDFNAQAIIQTASVNEILRHSHAEGFFVGDVSKVLLINDGSAWAQKASIPADEIVRIHQGTFGNGVAEPNVSAKATPKTSEVLGESNAEPVKTTQAQTNSAHSPTASDAMEVDQDTAQPATVGAAVQGTQSAANNAGMFVGQQRGEDGSSNAGQPSITNASNRELDLPSSVLRTPDIHGPNGELLYHLMFDPESEGPIFDPYAGNEFDAYNI